MSKETTMVTFARAMQACMEKKPREVEKYIGQQFSLLERAEGLEFIKAYARTLAAIAAQAKMSTRDYGQRTVKLMSNSTRLRGDTQISRKLSKALKAEEFPENPKDFNAKLLTNATSRMRPSRRGTLPRKRRRRGRGRGI